MASDQQKAENGALRHEAGPGRSYTNASSFAASLPDGDPMGIVDVRDDDNDLTKSLTAEQRARESMWSASSPVMQFILFALCAFCGSLIPLLTDFSKTYNDSYTDANGTHSCEGMLGHVKACQGKIGYIPTWQIFMEKCSSLTVSLALTMALSGSDGLSKVFKADRLKMIAPIALFNAGGDLAMLLAIGATSASFFQVIGQTRLLATALLSLMVLKKNQTAVQWMLLSILTIACVLYCDLDLYLVQGSAGQKAEMELTGLSLALLKVVLGAANAVLTERAFKAAPEEPIWVNQSQLSLCSCPVAFAFFALKGMYLCSPGSCAQDVGFYSGWTWKVSLLVAGQILNNFVIGLVYKYVDAVVKYLAYAQSLWITYIVNIIMLGVAFYFDLFLVVIILVLVVIAYSLSKAPAASGKVARKPTFTEIGGRTPKGNMPDLEMPRR